MSWFKRKRYEAFTATLPDNRIEHVLDRTSGTWLFIRDRLESEIVRLREQNDKLTLDPVATAGVRGQIKMAKWVLDLTRPDDVVRSTTFAAGIFGAGREEENG